MVDVLLTVLVNGISIYMTIQYFLIAAKEKKAGAAASDEGVFLHGRNISVAAGFVILWIILNMCCFFIITDTGIFEIISAAGIAVILLFESMLEIWKDNSWTLHEARREQMIQRQLQYYSRQYEALMRFQETVRHQRHERKNNNIVLMSLAEKGDIAGIREQLLTERDELCAKSAVISGNRTVDAVLSYELKIAEENHIKTDVSVSVPSDMDINDSVLCGILGNALDNAVEASLLIPEEKRHISIFIKVEMKNLFIEIRNIFDGKVITRSGDRIISRKDNIAEHGMGLNIIKDFAARFSGTVDIFWEGNEFVLRVMLCHAL